MLQKATHCNQVDWLAFHIEDESCASKCIKKKKISHGGPFVLLSTFSKFLFKEWDFNGNGKQ